MGKTPRQIARMLEHNPVPKLDDKTEFWKTEAQRLSRELEKANKQRAAVQVLIDEVQDVAPVKYNPPKNVSVITHHKSGSPQSAVLLFSDTHIGAVVRPEQTLCFGGYDFPTFLRRLKRLEISVQSILKDHTTTQVPELVIATLGDMIDGALQHSAEIGQVNTLFSQFYSGGHAIAQFFRNISALVPKVRIYTCVGNHPRWQNQKRMPTKNRFSNLDMFLYAYVKSLLSECTNIEIHIDQQPFSEFEVQGFRFLAAHGDHLKGGDKALGIPSHSIGRAVSAAAQLRAKHGRPGVNYYVVGHLHRPMELPHALGEILVNGGFPGIDEFGMAESFTPCSPIQKFFLVHPKFGRSACYDLNLSLAEKTGIPYNLPEGFPMI